MKKNHYLKLLRGVYGGLLAVFLFVSGYSVQAETSQEIAASQVLNSYLESLANGDVQQLSGLVGSAMKKRNRQLSLDPDYYGEFLRAHYSGVVMLVESVTDKGETVEAKVRFDYPTSQSTAIIFVLSQAEGGWRITDEIF
jgi:hypothetical protein